MKTLSCSLILLGIAALTGCGGSEPTKPEPTRSGQLTPPPQQQPAPKTTPQPEPEREYSALLSEPEAHVEMSLVAGKSVPLVKWRVKYTFLVTWLPDRQNWYHLRAEDRDAKWSNLTQHQGPALAKTGYFEGFGHAYKEIPKTLEFSLAHSRGKGGSAAVLAKRVSCPVVRKDK